MLRILPRFATVHLKALRQHFADKLYKIFPHRSPEHQEVLPSVTMMGLATTAMMKNRQVVSSRAVRSRTMSRTMSLKMSGQAMSEVSAERAAHPRWGSIPIHG
jgi:hypothetical protein